MPALRERERNRNMGRHRSILKDSYESHSPEALQENKNNLDIMIQDLNRYQVLQGNLNVGVASTKAKNQSGRNLNELADIENRVVSN